MRASPRSLARRLFLPSALVVVGLVLFFFLLDMVRFGTGLAMFDQPIHDWFTAGRSDALNSPLIAVSIVADPVYFSVIAFAIGLTWALLSRHWWHPTLLVIATISGNILNVVIKKVVERPRPPVDEMLMPASGTFSFPSGHTMGTTVFLLVLYYLLLRSNRNGVKVLALSLVVMLGIAVVAYSRLYVGCHWFTDVTASILLGVVVLGLAIVVDRFRPAATERIIGVQR